MRLILRLLWWCLILTLCSRVTAQVNWASMSLNTSGTTSRNGRWVDVTTGRFAFVWFFSTRVLIYKVVFLSSFDLFILLMEDLHVLVLLYNRNSVLRLNRLMIETVRPLKRHQDNPVNIRGLFYREFIRVMTGIAQELLEQMSFQLPSELQVNTHCASHYHHLYWRH